jgi:CubicO group peptidase (beta-lactamase class C family)
MANKLPAVCLTALLMIPVFALRDGPRSDPRPDRAAQELDDFFRAQVRHFGLASIGACILKENRIAWSGGFGWADVEKRRPATSQTTFNVGSVSKTVTLAAFMKLWEQGRCALDDDVDQYLAFPVRNPRFPDAPITIRMLLSFTAGIYDVDFQAGRNRLDVFSQSRDPDWGAGDDLREFLAPGGKYYSSENYFDFAPGDRYAYSNSSYALIGCVVERLAGRPFWDYCREALFVPLGMTDSSWRLADRDRDRVAFGYLKESGVLRKEEPTTWSGYMDGGLTTTLEDIGHFLIMMMNRGRFDDRPILKPETVDAMLALKNPPGAPPGRGFPTLGRGFVWILSQIRDREIFQMNGFGPAFFAQVYFDPSRKTGGAFLTTGGFDSFQALGQAVLGFLCHQNTASVYRRCCFHFLRRSILRPLHRKRTALWIGDG